jgi:ferredoxin--NADP+ reductase
MTTVPASDKHYTARIIEGKDLSEDLWLIRVDPGGLFQFKAGQYATLGVDHKDKRIDRAYPIVSSPYEQGLEFFIELVPEGALTPHLYKLQLGDTMFCRKVAKGRFTIDIKSGRT